MESGETPPTSFSSLLRPMLGARPHGQRRDGLPRREEPGKVQAAVIRREREREGTKRKKNVLFKEKEKRGKSEAASW